MVNTKRHVYKRTIFWAENGKELELEGRVGKIKLEIMDIVEKEFIKEVKLYLVFPAGYTVTRIREWAEERLD